MATGAKTPPTTNRVAWIGAGALVVAAIIGAFAAIWSHDSRAPTEMTQTAPGVQQDVHVENSPGANVFQSGRDLNVYVESGKRVIPLAGQEVMRQLLTPFAGQTVKIYSVLGDAETFALATQLKDVF